jgi:hypothetical protein
MRFRSRRVIEFLCCPEDQGVIAEPVHARTVLPLWYRQLPGIDKAQVTAINDGLIVKRWMPFLEAVSIGWILPLAATVRLEISDGGATVAGGWKFDRVMVSNHGSGQILGNPCEPRPPMEERTRITRSTEAGAGWYHRHARASRQELTPTNAR